MTIENAAQLLVETIEQLSRRAPAIVAAAARQMAGVTLGLHFGDGTDAELWAEHSRLVVRPTRSEHPDVEAYFDDRSLNLLFDLERKPVDELWQSSLDVRGTRPQVLAIWRTFQLLAQRASGLRAVQGLWRDYRDRHPQLWGVRAKSAMASRSDIGNGAPHNTGWPALDYLDTRHPEDTDALAGTVGGSVLAHSRSLWDGRRSDSWWTIPPSSDADLMSTMEACKKRVGEEILRVLPDREPKAQLYDLLRKYPEREGKGLRLTLAIATCCAFGGRAEDAVRTAAAIELFHNGFLIMDDLQDESTDRRGKPTLHEEYGIGLASNAGMALNLFSVDTVLSNLPTLGLARTLALIHEVIHMCRESVEGQAIELGWIRGQVIPPRDEDYYLMSTKKTGWYTCISPCRMGAICAGETDPVVLDKFNETFRLIGIAFQTQDDVLNVIGDRSLYQKEEIGDLFEAKRTIMLIDLFRKADPETRLRLSSLLFRPRSQKTFAEMKEVLAEMHRHGSIEYAIALADRLAHEGAQRFEEDLAFLPETEAKAVLRQIANYVTTRPL